jgi:hypothetical protein
MTTEPITDWDFEKNGRSVLAVCHHGLTELDKLLQNWNERFGNTAPGIGETV